MLKLTTETKKLQDDVAEEIESLLWDLSYNYFELEVKDIQKNLNFYSLVLWNCEFQELDTNSYKIKGLCSKTISLTGDLEVDVTNLLYGIVSAITGIEEYNSLACECEDMERIIEPTISLGLSDYRDQKQSSDEYDDYYNLGNLYASLSQLEDERLEFLASY